jgi:hypothetical protein
MDHPTFVEILNDLDENQVVELLDSLEAIRYMPHLRQDEALMSKVNWRISRANEALGERIREHHARSRKG